MKIRWQLFAGGTSAAAGKHSYAAYESVGQYHIDPISWPNGKHRNYRVMFANTAGKLGGLLWHTIGSTNSPNGGKKLCQEHATKHFGY